MAPSKNHPPLPRAAPPCAHLGHRSVAGAPAHCTEVANTTSAAQRQASVAGPSDAGSSVALGNNTSNSNITDVSKNRSNTKNPAANRSSKDGPIDTTTSEPGQKNKNVKITIVASSNDDEDESDVSRPPTPPTPTRGETARMSTTLWSERCEKARLHRRGDPLREAAAASRATIAMRNKREAVAKRRWEKKSAKQKLRKLGSKGGGRDQKKPLTAPLGNNRRGNGGKEAKLRLAVWRSAMDYAKLLYGVNRVEPETDAPDIGFSGPRRGGLVRAVAREPTGKFVEPKAAPSAGYGKTWVAVGGELCNLDLPIYPSYLSCTRNGDFRLQRSLDRDRTPDDTYREYLEIVTHLPKTSVKPSLAGQGLFAEQDIAADARIPEYTGNRVCGHFRDLLNAAFKSRGVSPDL